MADNGLNVIAAISLVFLMLVTTLPVYKPAPSDPVEVAVIEKVEQAYEGAVNDAGDWARIVNITVSSGQVYEGYILKFNSANKGFNSLSPEDRLERMFSVVGELKLFSIESQPIGSFSTTSSEGHLFTVSQAYDSGEFEAMTITGDRDAFFLCGKDSRDNLDKALNQIKISEL